MFRQFHLLKEQRRAFPRRAYAAPLALALALLVILPQQALAHALGISCQIVAERVEVEVYFDDNTPASEAAIRVLDANGQVVAEGRTDSQGRWSFSIAATGKYHVEANAGAGHRARKEIVIETGRSADVGQENAPVPVPKDREEFTRFPLLQIVLGLAIIGGLALVLRFILRARRTPG